MANIFEKPWAHSIEQDYLDNHIQQLKGSRETGLFVREFSRYDELMVIFAAVASKTSKIISGELRTTPEGLTAARKFETFLDNISKLPVMDGNATRAWQRAFEVGSAGVVRTKDYMLEENMENKWDTDEFLDAMAESPNEGNMLLHFKRDLRLINSYEPIYFEPLVELAEAPAVYEHELKGESKMSGLPLAPRKDTDSLNTTEPWYLEQ